MKRARSLLLIATVALACARPGASANRRSAPDRLPDVAAINEWAQKTSWGGMQVDTFTFEGREAIVVRRSFTSGVETCGITVFVRSGGAWVPTSTLDVWGSWLAVTQDGDSIRAADAATKAEVARFSISRLQVR